MSWWREQAKHWPVHAAFSVIGFSTTVLALVFLGIAPLEAASLVALYGIVIFALTIELGDLLWKYIYPYKSLRQYREFKKRDFVDAILDFLSWVLIPLWAVLRLLT